MFTGDEYGSTDDNTTGWNGERVSGDSGGICHISARPAVPSDTAIEPGTEDRGDDGDTVEEEGRLLSENAPMIKPDESWIAEGGAIPRLWFGLDLLDSGFEARDCDYKPNRIEENLVDY